ncbi:hypothetical protein [Nocardioides sp. ChNu-99]|uniref:hypothetical protein n=1 Tax=Nocardioides sp. ChNu-99 TaxID=2839897 RepID=UPI002405546F|nr:hypothetical protein [Nocardioides sp. ChNu-99]MDF9717878.1 hypothetical protein [Nocardioides sp. ChNu-99]
MAAGFGHVWVDPTARWGIDTARVGLLMTWRRDERDGSWWGFCAWFNTSAPAHGGSPRMKLDWMHQSCLRPVDASGKPPLDLSWVKPVKGVPT